MAEVVWFSFRVLSSPMLFTAFPSRQGTAVARFFAGFSGVGLNQNNVTDTVVFRSLFDLGGAAPQYPRRCLPWSNCHAESRRPWEGIQAGHLARENRRPLKRW
jgi:hypothetical protein